MATRVESSEYFSSRVLLQDDPPPPEDDENKEKRTDDISTWDADFLKVGSSLLADSPDFLSDLRII